MVRRKHKGRNITLSLSIVLVLVLIVMFYIWHQAESTRLGYRIHELETTLESLEQEISALEAERAELLAPDRVERIAVQELGFTDIRSDQIVGAEAKSERKETP